MRRQQVQPISAALTDFLRENGLEKPIMERRVAEFWPEVMGNSVARLTRQVEVDNGLLKVKLSSAALRAQLFECRFELIKKLNDAVGAEVIKDVRLI